MFIPYRARIKVTRIPVMTIVVAVVCLLVYWAQARSDERILAFAKSFCTEEIAVDILRGQQIAFPGDTQTCDEILGHIHVRPSPERHLAWHRQRIELKGDKEASEMLERHYRAFARQAPGDLTASLVHQSGSWNPLRLLSATISHGSWDHVIGNLFFFVAFATVVETVIGPVLFLLIFLAMGLGSGALENMLTITREGVGSLGLSGVVMGVMTLAAYLAPKVKIKFFYFYFLFFGVLSWPLWSVASWYVFWDLWNYHFWRDWRSISYVGHLTGAAMGLILGVTLFREKRHWVEEQIVVDEPSINEDQSWLSKLNTLGATPVVMYFVFIYGFLALLVGSYLFVTFIKTFSAQLLIAAPVVAGIVQIYRMKQSKKPDRVRLAEGLKLMDSHHFQQAERVLKPLAEANYPRGQYALGRLYATAPNLKNIPDAIHWFDAAATRGLPEALHELGTRYYHGMGVGKDLDRAIQYLEQAAQKGLPEAASTLGYVYENAPKGRADKEKAIEWYYRAGVSFYKAGMMEDAKTILTVLYNITAGYPAVFQMVAELERLLQIKASDKKGRRI